MLALNCWKCQVNFIDTTKSIIQVVILLKWIDYNYLVGKVFKYSWYSYTKSANNLIKIWFSSQLVYIVK